MTILEQLYQTIVHKLANGNHEAVTDLQMVCYITTIVTYVLIVFSSWYSLLQKTLKKYDFQLQHNLT